MRPSRWIPAAILAILVVASSVGAAATLTEDFEKFDAGEDPDRNWYRWQETNDENASVANATNTSMIIGGQKSVFLRAPASLDAPTRSANLRLEAPRQLSDIQFTVQGAPPANHTGGSRQVIQVQQVAPTRTMVGFYLFCDDDTNATSCELKVRFRHIDSTGQTLVNHSLNETRFDIRIVPDWVNSQYRLFVNGVDDGIFPFLELPQSVGRIRMAQHQTNVALNMTADDFLFDNARNTTAPKADGDVATGLQNFAQDIRFTTTGSQFFLAIIFFLITMAALIVPLIAIGQDNTTLSSTVFIGVLATLFYVELEWFPDWVGIAMVIFAAAVAAMVIRRLALGVQDASAGPGLVVGSLGYFVIASALLAFSGYATDTIEIPESPVEQTERNGTQVDETQSFAGAVVECVFSGGAVTFGIVGDCSQETTTSTFKAITDAAGNIFGWVQASVNFVFQLLTFSFPIPTIFNIAIVGPPAMSLAAYAVEVIRGS